MKFLAKHIVLIFALLLISGCAESSNKNIDDQEQEQNEKLEVEEDNVKKEVKNEVEHENNDKKDVETEVKEEEQYNEKSSKINLSESSTKDSNLDEEQEIEDNLSNYSSSQIEYARVWLQLGPNQEIDQLYVQHIPAGTPLNPNDETSLSYPEDIIQLYGSRLVDGSVTYSGNGDGTINVYNVPLRWDGVYPAGEEFYQNIIENTRLIYIDPNDDDKVIKFIKILNVN